MNQLKNAVNTLFENTTKSFTRFPVAVFSALLIAIIAMIRVFQENIYRSDVNFLYNTIQLSLFLTAIFSQASIAFYEVEKAKDKKSFAIANGSAILVGIIAFIALYFLGLRIDDEGYKYIASIAQARVIAATLISAIAFVYIASKSKHIKDFASSFFMSHRSFVISMIYGLVILIGTLGVLGAFEALIYNAMSYKIYQYFAIAAAFLTYIFFLGYFPSFKADANLAEIEEATNQPEFIIVLLDKILLPIMFALSAVLIVWTIRVLFSGVEVTFTQLSSIATAYIIIGIWLHIMVSKHNTKLANLYKLVYPFAALYILAFEAWALFIRIGEYGLKTEEYSFAMIWIFALISVLLLILLKTKAYKKIALVAIAITTIWVLPFVGYEDLTYSSQISRLKKTLISNNMLVDDKIIKASTDIDRKAKFNITDSVDYITNSDKEKLPAWLSEDLYNNFNFEKTFGFVKTYEDKENLDNYYWQNIQIATGVENIDGYTDIMKISLNQMYESNDFTIEANGDTYEINWSLTKKEVGIPVISVKKNGQQQLDENLEEFLLALTQKYPYDANQHNVVPIEDMSLTIENADFKILLILESVEVSNDGNTQLIQYYVSLSAMYFKTK